MMKNKYLIPAVIIVALLLSACSGDGQGSFDTGEEKIVITSCEDYIITQTNDLLVKDDDNTTIKVIHDVNGTKKVCVLSGSAHIIREAN